MKWLVAGIAAVLLAAGSCRAQDTALTPKSLQQALAGKPTGADAEKLADRIRAWIGKDKLATGTPQLKTEELTVAWAIESPDATAPPRIVTADDSFSLVLTRLGSSPVYTGAATLSDGQAFAWSCEVNGKKLAGANLEVYKPDPDGIAKPGVPKGEVRDMPKWESKIFAGTTRDWSIYVPAQYKPENPACVMVFQDGGGYKGFVPTVFDNLIAKGEMPVTVAIFINPGNFIADKRSNRSFEYDTLSDQYARMLLEEILPEVEKTVKLRHDAASRAISGGSSGGICAFTVAWERPMEFSKVLSWVGSFTNIQQGATFREGGHNYEAMVRKAPKRPIRIFLQDGSNDLDNANGNWPLANQTLAKSLAFAGYDYKFVYGHGFHSGSHGRAIFSDSLRWLWRDYKP